MDTLRDYLNPERIYTDGLHDVGVSNLERTTPTVKESLTTAEDCSGDEVVYSTPICSGKSSETAPIRENLTTAESAEKCRVGEPGYPTANGRQVKNGTGIEEIERGTLDLQVGTAEESSDVALNWFRYELTALRLWAKDSWLVEPLTLYRHEDALAIAEYFQAAIDALSKTAESAEKCPTTKPGTETVPNCGTETCQSAGTECNWCDPNQDRLQFRVSWWTRSLGGKHHWFSVTEQHKANYCPMCGRKLEGRSL